MTLPQRRHGAGHKQQQQQKHVYVGPGIEEYTGWGRGRARSHSNTSSPSDGALLQAMTGNDSHGRNAGPGGVVIPVAEVVPAQGGSASEVRNGRAGSRQLGKERKQRDKGWVEGRAYEEQSAPYQCHPLMFRASATEVAEGVESKGHAQTLGEPSQAGEFQTHISAPVAGALPKNIKFVNMNVGGGVLSFL